MKPNEVVVHGTVSFGKKVLQLLVPKASSSTGLDFEDDAASKHENAHEMPSSDVDKFLKTFDFGEEFDSEHPDEEQEPHDMPKHSDHGPGPGHGELACLICGGNAGKHVHYGGQACYSCKAFFRRAVKDDVYKKFSCAEKNCKIDSKSWRSCKWCRNQNYKTFLP